MTTFLNKKVLLLLIVIVGINNQGCGDKIFGGDDDRLLIVNQSDKAIYTGSQTNYPDTLISNYNPYFNDDNDKILSRSQKRLHARSWPQLVVQSVSDTMMVFIYDATTQMS